MIQRLADEAGGGAGALGDGGPATAATIGGNLFGVAVDAAGNLYITTDARIRRVDATTGLISTIAGTGSAGFSGDGALATNAMIHGAITITVDSAGNVYFADGTNLRVRKLTPAQIVAEGVANSATFKAGGISPGEIISSRNIFGSHRTFTGTLATSVRFCPSSVITTGLLNCAWTLAGLNRMPAVPPGTPGVTKGGVTKEGVTRGVTPGPVAIAGAGAAVTSSTRGA